MTPAQITFIEIAVCILLGAAAMFWCGWVARDGQVRAARAEESFQAGRAEQWKQQNQNLEARLNQSNGDLERTLARIAELEKAMVQEPEPVALGIRKGKAFPAPERSTGRRRGPGGRFIKS